MEIVEKKRWELGENKKKRLKEGREGWGGGGGRERERETDRQSQRMHGHSRTRPNTEKGQAGDRRVAD